MKKYDSTAFNKVFDSVTENAEPIHYQEPEALPLARNLQYTELGKAKTGDFSSTSEGESGKSLQYTDYMRAYTTTRLVDPRAVQQRQNYRNVDEYEKARSAANVPETEQEKQWRLQREQQAAFAEEQRLQRVSDRDNRVALHHDNVSRLMMSSVKK